MKSITIHGLEDPLNTLIREKAQQKGLSLNKTIKELLSESLGITSINKTDRENEFSDLCGIWTKKENAEFNKKISALGRIDPEDWE